MVKTNVYAFVKIIIQQTNNNEINLPDAVDILIGCQEINKLYSEFFKRPFTKHTRIIKICRITKKIYAECSWSELTKQLTKFYHDLNDELQKSIKSLYAREELFKCNTESYEKYLINFEPLEQICEEARNNLTAPPQGVFHDEDMLIWSNEVKATETCGPDCGLPWHIQNGDYKITDTTYLSVLEYSCKSEDYFLVGSNELRYCLSNSTWTYQEYYTGCYGNWVTPSYEETSCSNSVKTKYRECSSEMFYLREAIGYYEGFGCFDPYVNDFTTCQNTQQSSGRICEYTVSC